MKTFRSFLTAFSITSCLIFFGYCIAIVTATDSLADTKVAENKPEPANKEKDQSKDKKITFNFIDVDISTVVKFISEITSKNFVFDDRVKGNITIIAPTKLSIEEAFSLFTSVLELKGFTVVPSGKIYKIVPVSQARQSSTEIIKDEKPHVGDTYVTR